MKKVKEVSDIVGVSKRTLQYYDDEEMLSVKRSSENHRLYSREDMDKAWRILLMQSMGCSLKEIKDNLQEPDSDMQNLFARSIERFEAEAAELKRRSLMISRISRYGLPPVMLPEEYSGKATYAECIGIITDVLGTDEREFGEVRAAAAQHRRGTDMQRNTGESCMSREFINWLEGINDRRLSGMIRDRLRKYCTEKEATPGRE